MKDLKCSALVLGLNNEATYIKYPFKKKKKKHVYFTSRKPQETKRVYFENITFESTKKNS